MRTIAIVITGAVAASTALGMWIVESWQGSRESDGVVEKRCYVRGMREREYLRLIPQGELKPLKALLRDIYKARGWVNDEAARSQAWANVLSVAKTPEGGGWLPDFQPTDATSQQLLALCIGIEKFFLGGLLATHIKRACRPELRVELGVDPRDAHSWLSGLHEDNTIYINANRWRESITEDNPMNFEGALCYCKLEALAHALGHELVHAVVLNFFPDMDASSDAYTPDDKHGPIFMLLNKRIFGHVGHASQRLFEVD